jgi:hypothetical protein
MVCHGHSSSLYSNSPSSLNKQVQKFVDSTDPEANLLTYTEVGSDQRTEVLKDADPDWAGWVPDATDVGLMWEKSKFHPIWKHCVKLTDKVWTDGQGRKHTTYCATALLEKDTGDNAGKTVFLSVCHLPSHVQNGKNFYDNAQAKAWKSACAGWNDHWNEVRKEDHPDLALIVADWNVDFHMDVWRDRVQDYFPSMFLGWKGNMPPDGKGTHGSRLIDGTMATVKANWCELLKDDSSSDHRPYGEAVPF